MHRPVPRWLPWAGVAVAALLVAGLIHLPQAIDGERALDNALIAEKQGDYPGAVKQLHILLERYPDSDRWTAQLGIDQYLAGDTVAAVHTFDHLSLNRLDNTTRTKVDRVRTDIQKHAGLTDRV